jgi:hypothetical protein
MEASVESTTMGSNLRLSGWLAIVSGIAAVITIASLITYLATQVDIYLETGVMPMAGAILLFICVVGATVQALSMIPVAFTLDSLARERSGGLSRAILAVGVVALCLIVLLRLLPLASSAVSDILFMGPMGFLGAWMVVINRLLKGKISRGVRFTGVAAGVGFFVAGCGFFFLGGIDSVMSPNAYAENLPFHYTLWFGAIPGFILFPIWAILLGRRLLAR